MGQRLIADLSILDVFSRLGCCSSRALSCSGFSTFGQRDSIGRTTNSAVPVIKCYRDG